jgi:hypothetical protein
LLCGFHGGGADLVCPLPVWLRDRHAPSPHLDFFGGGFRGHIVEQDARLGLLDMLVEDDTDDDVLMAAKGTADADTVTFAHRTVRFWRVRR